MSGTAADAARGIAAQLADLEMALSGVIGLALSFVLAQDIYGENFETHAEVQALEQRQIRDDGRRILWMAHESAPKNFTAVDVTDPANPRHVVTVRGLGYKIQS